MQVEAYTKDNKFVCKLENDSALLGSYPLDDGMRLHVIDQFQIRNELDFGNVPKYELSQEEYEQKSDSVRAFLQRNKLGNFSNICKYFSQLFVLSGKYNEGNQKKKETLEAEEEKIAKSVVINSRCKVTIQNAPSRLGTVMYAGTVEGLSGYWIGIKYDEPLGKNDGM